MLCISFHCRSVVQEEDASDDPEPDQEDRTHCGNSTCALETVADRTCLDLQIDINK
jgi:hypothetical protein